VRWRRAAGGTRRREAAAHPRHRRWSRRSPRRRPPAARRRRRGWFVQLGAFRRVGRRRSFQRRVADEVEWLLPLLATFGDATLYRVQAGPYPSRADAQGAAARVRDALGLVPVIVERR
jgi:cell division septation protein DedD